MPIISLRGIWVALLVQAVGKDKTIVYLDTHGYSCEDILSDPFTDTEDASYARIRVN